MILNAEAAQVHRDRVEKHPDKFGKDVLGNLQRGLEVKAIDYLQALEDRERLSDEVEEAMEGVDAILVPATPRVAPVVEESDGVRPLMTRFTRPFNVTGQPIMTLPAPPTGCRSASRWWATTARTPRSRRSRPGSRRPGGRRAPKRRPL